MSGALVVPLFYKSTPTDLLDTLGQINGVLFPGGSQIIDINNTLTKNADLILKYSIEQAKKGIRFPIWGTCGGHGLLAYLTSNYSPNTRQPIDNALGIMNKLYWKNASAEMVQNIPKSVL